MKTLYKRDEVTKKIEEGKRLLIAGDQRILEKLPKGKWIGGTIPYFMSERGGLCTAEEVQVTELPDAVEKVDIKWYDESTISQLGKDYPQKGISYIIVPAFSGIHQTYARDVSSYDNIYHRPLVGWISGVNLEDIGRVSPKVFNGETGEGSSDKALVMHGTLRENTFARMDILNIFDQGEGDTITFSQGGFEARECQINGESRNLAEYVVENNIDIQLPLVADYSGAMINISFQAVEKDQGLVKFYAPVFPGVEYRVAKSVGNYEEKFREELDKRQVSPVFSCNCILNYGCGKLEGKKTGSITGPMTFGEIAYILLNQTMVYVTYEEK